MIILSILSRFPVFVFSLYSRWSKVNENVYYLVAPLSLCLLETKTKQRGLATDTHGQT
jgi:hypothetical protein